MSHYLIETKRLGLRLLQKEDIEYLEDLESDAEVRRYFPTGVKNRAQTEAFIAKFLSNYAEKNLPCFVLFELPLDENTRQNEGIFVGRAGFGLTDEGEVEVGYLLHKKCWGKGYATEALQAILTWAKEHLSVDYVIAFADPENRGSIRVMEKCGMEYYKTGTAHGITCRFYRIKNR